MVFLCKLFYNKFKIEVLTMENDVQIELIDPSIDLVEDIISIKKNINTSNTFVDYDGESEYETQTDEVKKEVEN